MNNIFDIKQTDTGMYSIESYFLRLSRQIEVKTDNEKIEYVFNQKNFIELKDIINNTIEYTNYVSNMAVLLDKYIDYVENTAKELNKEVTLDFETFKENYENTI